MASVQEPEVQFAQRLASNEKPVRTRAMKKLRKYIFVRSQKATGGFTGEELLKLWKGLFYCLWMQDKLLLQEELNAQISSLLHSFQDVDGQFLYLDSFLQTFKREWTGIDRLRMDKFFQLVRFMFRQTFEMLKRTNWDSSVVSRFLELLTVQLLQSKSAAPTGLQFHILDLYMSELAAVASQQLTADQNLKFIEPFCRTAAKTKDRTLFRAICSSIFSTIIDQAPFAIEDLMKELEADEVSDSGQASGEEDDDDGRGRKMLNEDVRKERINGHRSNDDDESPLCDDDTEPVLQFDYGALAARLLELASGGGTPSHNRQRLYKIVKVLRDLSEGIFPQDEYPEEVSTDEDDDMFGSRKRMKRRGDLGEDDAPDSKKTKRKKKEPAALNKEIKESANDENEPAVSKKKKRKKKKKKKALPGGATTEASEEKQTETSQKEAQNTDSAEKTLEEEEGPSEPSVTGENDKMMLSEEKVGELQERAGVSSNTEVVVSEKKKKSLNTAKNLEVNAMSVEEDSSPAKNVKHEEVGIDAQEEEHHAGMTSVSKETAANGKFKKKKNRKQEEVTSPAAHQCVETPPKKNQDDGAEEETPLEAQMENTTRMTPVKRKKKKKLPGNKNDADGERKEVLEGQIERLSSSETPAKKKKKERKIPVVFEFEADELEATSVNGITGDETTAKKTEVMGDVREPSSPLSAQRSQKKKKKKATSSDFITFQSNTTVPTPLFFRTKGSLSTPLSSRKKTQTPKSESKKVTFGLKNNKTAEFKKTDRSLLVSPDGSSRIPFDPKQKPKFGVLKSPATPRSAKLQKMAASNRKRFSSPQVTPKGRPTAADFF